jgi:hypothetical protein
MSVIRATCVAIGIGVSTPSLAEPLLQPMDPDRPVKCARDTSGLVWRLQCDTHTHVCLYAPDAELDGAGNRGKPLERARECEVGGEPFDREKLEAEGFVMKPGIADAPYGWMRDERGRVFQIDFDLHRRMYFGIAYAPRAILENPTESKRTSINFGLLVADWLERGRNPTRHRLRLGVGEVHMVPFSAELTLAHYDVSHRWADPLLRITTFVGTPQRHDLHLDLGLWTEGGGLELRRTALGNSQLWKHATAQVTLDLWASPDLESFLRVRTGAALEGQHDDINGYRSAMTETSALDLDCMLDDSGFHNLRFEIAHEVPHYFSPYTSMAGVFVQRMHAKVQYEAIVLAINDQPLTLNLAAGGEKRNDIPGIPDTWAFVLDAGLRFSLWAPPHKHS